MLYAGLISLILRPVGVAKYSVLYAGLETRIFRPAGVAKESLVEIYLAKTLELGQHKLHAK